MESRNILIIEDDAYIAELERDFLVASDFQVDIFQDGIEGETAFFQKEYAAVILDLMIPGKDGIHICKRIRETSNVPIIIVTAKKEDVDKIRGLSVGADDYIVKPFSPTEMVARVKAHIEIHKRITQEEKRDNGHESEVKDYIEIDGLRVYQKARKVERNGVEIALTNKEFEILDFFIENPNIAFSKERLFDRIWGLEAMGDLSTVTVHVNRLRDKIEKDPSNPVMIQTVWGVGYRFSFV